MIEILIDILPLIIFQGVVYVFYKVTQNNKEIGIVKKDLENFKHMVEEDLKEIKEMAKEINKQITKG